MIYTQSDGDSPKFERWLPTFTKKLFPQYELQDLPADHPLYSSVFNLSGGGGGGGGGGKPPPRLRAVRNGSRILLLHSPEDIAASWQIREEVAEEDRFRLGVNIFSYAAGRRDLLRNRIDSPYVPEPADEPPPLGRVKVARVSYAGDWDPEPGAWGRYARLFEFNTGTGVETVPVAWKELKPRAAPFAHLTGTARHDASDAEVAALRAYVEAGGVVFADDCGGSGRFAASVADALKRAFPTTDPEPLTAAHPLLREGEAGTGMADLTKPQIRTYAAERGFKNVLPRVLRAGDGAVVVSRLDVTSGLMGTGTWGISGYTSKYAEGLMQNLVLWTMDGLPEE